MATKKLRKTIPKPMRLARIYRTIGSIEAIESALSDVYATRDISPVSDDIMEQLYIMIEDLEHIREELIRSAV